MTRLDIVPCLRRLTAYTQPVLGSQELAGVLDISVPTLSNRLARTAPSDADAYHNVPRPSVHLRMGPIWTVENVRGWLVLRLIECGGTP